MSKESATTRSNRAKPLLEKMRQLQGDSQRQTMEAYLRKKLGIWLCLSDRELDQYRVSEIAQRLGEDWEFLAYCFLKDFGLRFYPNELQDLHSVPALAAYLSTEINPPQMRHVKPASDTRVMWPWETAMNKPLQRNASMAFVLSTPRSGSTLLRVMLARHVEIFAPPELHLLPFATMESRERQICNGFHFLRLGLVQAVAGLYNCSLNDSAAKVQTWIEEDLPIWSVYAIVQEELKSKLLVDKTPTYSANVHSMVRAEDLFQEPRYIFLVRHPLSMIESFVRMRFNRMMGTHWGVWDDDAYHFAAKVWNEWNRNITTFLNEVPSVRHQLVRYEDLVTAPEHTMSRLCEFLGVPFDPAVLNPFSENRMAYNQTKNVFTIGDPNFVTRDQIDPTLADWRHVSVPPGARQIVQELAGFFGYELP